MSSAPATPFQLEPLLQRLQRHYPPADLLQSVASQVNQRDLERIVRTWLSEGIPFVFLECPATYDALRTWLAERLRLAPRDITMIGSGRTGFSLAPSKWGRGFLSQQSDLDLSIVSAELFAALVQEFDLFRQESGNDTVHPRDDRERKLWQSNLDVVPRGIRRGAIDPLKIPSWNRYPTAQKVATAMANLNARFTRLGPAAPARKVTVRVYQGWQQLTMIVAYNLGTAARSVAA